MCVSCSPRINCVHLHITVLAKLTKRTRYTVHTRITIHTNSDTAYGGRPHERFLTKGKMKRLQRTPSWKNGVPVRVGLQDADFGVKSASVP